jgi:hypothetical protein
MKAKKTSDHRSVMHSSLPPGSLMQQDKLNRLQANLSSKTSVKYPWMSQLRQGSAAYRRAPLTAGPTNPMAAQRRGMRHGSQYGLWSECQIKSMRSLAVQGKRELLKINVSVYLVRARLLPIKGGCAHLNKSYLP